MTRHTTLSSAHVNAAVHLVAAAGEQAKVLRRLALAACLSEHAAINDDDRVDAEHQLVGTHPRTSENLFGLAASVALDRAHRIGVVEVLGVLAHNDAKRHAKLAQQLVALRRA